MVLLQEYITTISIDYTTFIQQQRSAEEREKERKKLFSIGYLHTFSKAMPGNRSNILNNCKLFSMFSKLLIVN